MIIHGVTLYGRHWYGAQTRFLVVWLFRSALGTWSCAFDLFNHAMIFSIAVYFNDHKSRIVVVLEDLVDYRIVSSCCLMFIGTRFQNFMIQLTAVIMPHSFTSMVFMHSSMSWCFIRSSLRTSIRSFLTGFNLRLVDLPFRLDMSGPNIFSAILTSSVVTGQFLTIFIQSNGLNLSIAGAPTMRYNFLASFAREKWLMIYPFLFFVTVQKLRLCIAWLACLFCSPWVPHIGITLQGYIWTWWSPSLQASSLSETS